MSPNSLTDEAIASQATYLTTFRLIRDSLLSLRQLRQNPVYLLLSQILVIRLIYLHHRRGAAGAEALDGEQGAKPPRHFWFDKIQMYGIISVDRVAERARDSISKLLGFRPAREPRSFFI